MLSFLHAVFNVLPRQQAPIQPVIQQDELPSLESDEEEEDGEIGSDENDWVATMIQYFESMADGSDASATILDQLKHNENGDPDAIGDDLFSRSNLNLKKEVWRILLSRIPERDRQKRLGDKALKQWLGSSNLYRSFMFFSKEKLAEINAMTSGIRPDTTASYDAMIKELIEVVTASSSSATNDNNLAGSVAAPSNLPTTAPTNNDQSAVTIKQEIIKAMLVKSFMRPLKGKNKEHCSMGHKLELPIALDWMRDVNEKKLFPGFTVISLHKIGLVAKKNHPWAKDSIDLLALVREDNQNDLQVWGIEIKSRLTMTTINEEKELNRKLRRKKYEVVESNEVFNYVKKASERFQILHHAYVYDFDRVAIIIANDSGKVISGTAINFDDELKCSYGKVVDDLKDLSLLWAYSTLPASDTIFPNDVIKISEDVPTINGKEALYGSFKLWKAMFLDPGPAVLPYPIIKRIIPSTHAEWNSTKGGSDTVTKIADDRVINAPRQHTNFESTATSRCISNLLITIFKCYQTVSSPNHYSSYPSLQHYRNAASSRVTFKRFLRMVYRILKAKVKSGETTMSGNQNQIAVPEPVRRARFKGTLPEKMNFAPSRSFLTPKKARKKQVERGVVSQEVIECVHQCTGYPVEVVCQQVQGNSNNQAKKDPRQRCYLCKNKTKWQCIKCRFYFCMTYKETASREESIYYTNEKENRDSKNHGITKIFGKSCFHTAHEKAISATLKKESSNS